MRIVRVALTAALGLAVLVAGLLHSSQAGAVITCDLVAAPTGSNSAAGSEADPFRTAQKLVDSLSSGQTGCLRAGAYASENEIKVSTGGITIASYPGERATVVGRLWIAEGANGVTVEDLNLNGSNATDLPSPTVNADLASFRNDDVTNDHTAICFNLGSHTWGEAHGTVIEGSLIHDCGQLPATNQDHGIYVSAATDTVIRDNWIYGNADRGIQLYPDAQRTTITGNVIDGNGEGIIFSGDDGYASSDNVVAGNVISNSKVRRNVESYWPQGNPVGSANLVDDNCVFASNSDDYYNQNGGIDPDGRGFTATSNTIADPHYAARGSDDFHLQADSPCLTVYSGTMSLPDAPGTGDSGGGPPSAAFGFEPAAPRTGDAVTFDGSASSDPDGSTAKYEWDLDGNGSFETDTGTTPTVTRSFAKSGTYTVSLRVTDDDGSTDVVSHQVTVANRPPLAAFSFTPTSPRKKESVTFDASGSRDPDGSISRYQWDLDGNGTFETDGGTGATVTHTYRKAGKYTVSLRVTDDEGAKAESGHRLHRYGHLRGASAAGRVVVQGWRIRVL